MGRTESFDSLFRGLADNQFSSDLEAISFPNLGPFDLEQNSRTAEPLAGSDIIESGRQPAQFRGPATTRIEGSTQAAGVMNNTNTPPGRAVNALLGQTGSEDFTSGATQYLDACYDIVRPTDATGFAHQPSPNILKNEPLFVPQTLEGAPETGRTGNGANIGYTTQPTMNRQPAYLTPQMPAWQQFPTGLQQPVGLGLNSTHNIPRSRPLSGNITYPGTPGSNQLNMQGSYAQQPSNQLQVPYNGTARHPAPYNTAQRAWEVADRPSPQQSLDIRSLKRTKPKLDPKKSHVRVNDTTEGKNLRPAKIEAFKPEVVYNPLLIRLPAWGRFRYLDCGEFEEAESYSVVELYSYLYQHPVSLPDINGRRQLRIWIQRLPADSARRYPTATSSRCRFTECPAAERRILPGHFRICFDELSQDSEDLNYDPFINAGYVHLFCMERLMDFPRIVRELNVLPENRTLLKEMGCKNKMSLGTGGVFETARGYIKACRAGTLPDFLAQKRDEIRRAGLNIQVGSTLNQLLQITKLREERGRRGMHGLSSEVNVNKFIEEHHLGNLILQRRERRQKSMKRRTLAAARRRANGADEEEEKEEEYWEEEADIDDLAAPSSKRSKTQQAVQRWAETVVIDDDAEEPQEQPPPPSGERRRYDLRATRNTASSTGRNTPANRRISHPRFEPTPPLLPRITTPSPPRTSPAHAAQGTTICAPPAITNDAPPRRQSPLAPSAGHTPPSTGNTPSGSPPRPQKRSPLKTEQVRESNEERKTTSGSDPSSKDSKDTIDRLFDGTDWGVEDI